MSVLSATVQQQVEDSLVKDNIITAEELASVKEKADETKKPFMSLLVEEGHITNEQCRGQ
jgi:hypothetical protein